MAETDSGSLTLRHPPLVFPMELVFSERKNSVYRLVRDGAELNMTCAEI